MGNRHNRSHDDSNNIRTAFFLNLGFTMLELFGGLWTNSLAILSDAIHDLGDSISLGLAWFLDRYSQRDRDRRFSYGYRRFSILDPVLSILITIYVLYKVVKNMRETVSLFLQAIPHDIDIAEIQAEIAAVEHVRSTHHTHIWSLDGQHYVLTTHVVVGETVSRDQVLHVKRDIKQILKRYQFSHITIEIEYDEADCAMV